RPPFNRPLFFDVIGFVLFSAAPVSLLVLGTRKRSLYDADNAERFYQVLLRWLARSQPETLDAIVDIVMVNLKGICKTLKAFNAAARPDDGDEARLALHSNAVFDGIV